MKYLKEFKHLQIYEKYKKVKPQVDDYVVVNIKDKSNSNMEVINFIENTIWQLFDITIENRFKYYCLRTDEKSEYGETRRKYGSRFDVGIKDIEYFSPNKKDCEIYLRNDLTRATKKFNI